jgi:hypothetical protein
MQGLGNSIYKESVRNCVKHGFLMDAHSYGHKLQLHYDFSLLTGDDGDNLASTAITNLGIGGSSYNGEIQAGSLAVSDGFTGINSLQLDGTNDYMSLSGAFTATDQNWTMFCVFHLDGTIGQDSMLAGSSGGVNRVNIYNNNNVHVRANGTGSSNGAKLIATNNTNNSSTSYQWNNDPDILVVRQDSDKSLYTYSGSAAASTAWYVGKSTDYSAASNTNIKIQHVGAHADEANDFQGWIGEIGVYDQDIGEQSVKDLIHALKDKWQI